MDDRVDDSVADQDDEQVEEAEVTDEEAEQVKGGPTQMSWFSAS